MAYWTKLCSVNGSWIQSKISRDPKLNHLRASIFITSTKKALTLSFWFWFFFFFFFFFCLLSLGQDPVSGNISPFFPFLFVASNLVTWSEVPLLIPYFYGWVKAQRGEMTYPWPHSREKWWGWNGNPGLLASRVAFKVWARLGVREGPAERGLWHYLLSPARLAKQLGLESLLSSSISVSSAGNLRMYLLPISDVPDVSLWVQSSWLMSKDGTNATIPRKKKGIRNQSRSLTNLETSLVAQRGPSEKDQNMLFPPPTSLMHSLLYGERFHPCTDRLCETGLEQDGDREGNTCSSHGKYQSEWSMTELGKAFCRENSVHLGVRTDTRVCCLTMRAPGDNAFDMDHSLATE